MILEEKLKYIPKNVVCVEDYESLAKTRVDENAWIYLHSGAGDEISLKNNKKSYEKISLLGSTLEDFKDANTKLTLFNQEYNSPIFASPIAYQKLFFPNGEISTAQACYAMDKCMVVSGFSSTSLEEIREYSDNLWFQLYMQYDMNDNLYLINKAKNLGYKALVITIDAPISGLRNKEQKYGFYLPKGVEALNIKNMKKPDMENSDSLAFSLASFSPSWKDIEFIRKSTDMPIILKGITNPSYAKKALDLGIDGIVVSNHGGRTLDSLVTPLDILPQITKVIDKKIPIFIDGGITRGTDILKALALGASAVFVGKALIYALCSSGALGVAHALKILQEELEIAMVLTGCKNLAEIDKSIIFDENNYQFR